MVTTEAPLRRGFFYADAGKTFSVRGRRCVCVCVWESERTMLLHRSRYVAQAGEQEKTTTPPPQNTITLLSHARRKKH